MTDSGSHFRIPHEEEYVAALGRAVYGFAYYEWGVVYLIDRLEPGFVRQYIESKRPMTSGVVARRLRDAVDGYRERTRHDDPKVLKIEKCLLLFDELREKRNRLIHAHPITDRDGSTQILSYQSFKVVHSQQWPRERIDQFACDVSKASLTVGSVYYDASW